MRVGMGFDVHRLEAGRALVLGGVRIPFEQGLAGHSDADVLVHAVMDALLGAVAAGDIGRHFPDTDLRYQDIDSLILLGRVMETVHQAGYRVGNLDTVVIAQRPRLSGYVDEMRQRMAEVLGVEAGAVSVKATTTEGLGLTGRGEGIAAQAVVLLATSQAGGVVERLVRTQP